MFAVLFAGVINAQTRTAMKSSELKKEITEYVAKNYVGYTIREAFKVETNKVITYEVIAQKESAKVTLVFNDKGGFVKMENQKATGTKPTPTPKKTTTTTTTKPKTGTK